MHWATIILAVCLAAVLCWNFIPKFRDMIRSRSTIIEGAMGVVLTATGTVFDAFHQMQQAGYIPPWAVKYVPAIFFAWFIYKRMITNSAVGEKRE